jgi:hypothetical protein
LPKTKSIKKMASRLTSEKKQSHSQVDHSVNKIKRVRKIMSKKHRLERIMKMLVMDLLEEKMSKQRKAKLQAVKTIKQLFINSKTKSQMFVDEKLIYI